MIAGKQFVPNRDGAVVYLDAGGDLDGAIERVQAEGGKVVMGRTLITESIGSIAWFVDTEGNRVALHSQRVRGWTRGRRRLKLEAMRRADRLFQIVLFLRRRRVATRARTWRRLWRFPSAPFTATSRS